MSEQLEEQERAIRRFGNRCLRVKCRRVEPGDPSTARLVRRLWRALDAGTGVGLAAPQIGDDRRVLIVRDPEAEMGQSQVTMVNPEIVETFGPLVPFEEGCLSFPGLFADVKRPQGVVVNYLNENGRAHQIRDEGMLARIVQHEVDHLDGVLFVDHLSVWRRFLLAPRLLWQLLGHGIWLARRGK